MFCLAFYLNLIISNKVLVLPLQTKYLFSFLNFPIYVLSSASALVENGAEEAGEAGRVLGMGFCEL